jgi:hypothetical protein
MLRRVVILLSIILAVLAQSPAQVKPEFRISGTAVNSVTGQPLPRAELSIRLSAHVNVILQKVLTEDDGRFEFMGLLPGKYELMAEKSGFRKQAYEGHGYYASAIIVGQGKISDNLVFRLHPDAWIEGTVTDAENEAVPNASVVLFHMDSRLGYKQILPAAMTNSDDRGYYRFAHLESGSYFIAVSAQPWFSSLALSQREVGSDLAPDEKSVVDVAFPTTYYPGVIDSSMASPIEVSAGEGATASLTLVAMPAVRLLVRHTSSNPAKMRTASLQQRVFNLPIASPSQVTVPTAPVDARSSQGEAQEGPASDFTEIRGIAPGKYVLTIQSYTPPSSRSTTIEITGNTEIDASVAEVAPIRGTVTLNGQSLLPHAFVRLWNWHTGEILDAEIEPNGKFEFNFASLLPGTYSVFAMNGLYSTIGSLSATGAKIAGQSIQVGGATPVSLTIEMPRHLSTIDGVVTRNGQPFAGAMVILVPDNAESNLPMFRRDQSDSDGTFLLKDVLPGHYRILAADDGWDIEWARRAVLLDHDDHAVNITVAPNQTYQTSINLER